MEADLKRDAALRLKVAAGHLESIRRMVDQEVYCVNIMKQVAAVQASLEQVQRLMLRNHLMTCVSDAVRHGMGTPIIDELVDAMKYMPFSAGEAIAPDAPLHALLEHPVCQCHADNGGKTHE
ncbi:MAG: metal-sensitive transcriptional regulator [Sulfobacillus sp.]